MGWSVNQEGLARQVSPAPFPQPGCSSRSGAGPVGTRSFLRALGPASPRFSPSLQEPSPEKGEEGRRQLSPPPSHRAESLKGLVGPCWCCCTPASGWRGMGVWIT